MEDRLDHAIDRLTAHVSGCEKHQEHEKEWREKTEGTISGMDAKLDKLVAAQDRAKGAWWAVTKVAAGIAALAGAASWAWDHFKPIVILALLLVPSASLAHEDDPVLRELQSPVTGGSCCNMTDCSLTDDWDQRAGSYVVRLAGAWVTVPDEIVIRGHHPHPSGRAVLCVSPAGPMLCFLPGAPQT